MEPTLAIINIDISSGQDEIAREGLLENLGKFRDDCLKVLWVNWLRERADLRLVCLVYDLQLLDDFLCSVVRKVPGVRGTSAQLAFDGVIHSDALMDVSLLNTGWDRRAAATVQIKLQPGRDDEAYEGLLNLPRHDQIQPVWVTKVFHSTNADMTMLLLGERTSALTGYVMSWVRTIPGVMDTELTTVLDWQIFGSTEDFIELARRFPVPEKKQAAS